MGRLPLAQGHVIRSQKDPGAITPVLPRLLIFFYRFIYILLSSPRGRMPMSHTAENSSRWATSKLMDDGIGKRANSFVRRSFRAGKRERRGNLSMCHIDRVASLRRLLIITEKWSAETIFSRSVNTDKLQKIFFFLYEGWLRDKRRRFLSRVKLTKALWEPKKKKKASPSFQRKKNNRNHRTLLRSHY